MGDNKNSSGSLVQEKISLSVQSLSVHRPFSSITAQPGLESLGYRHAGIPSDQRLTRTTNCVGFRQYI